MKYFVFTLCMMFIVTSYSQFIDNNVSFEKNNYFIEEGGSTEVCITLNNVDNLNEEIIISSSNGSNSFLEFSSKTIPFSNGKICLEINSKPKDGNINYQNQEELFITTNSESIVIGPLISANIFLQDDTKIDKNSGSQRFLIKGYDNDVSGEFSLSFINIEPIFPNDVLYISNLNYSNDFGLIPHSGNVLEYIELIWNGNQIIEPGKTFCITKTISTDFGNSSSELSISIDGNLADGISVVDFTSDSFLDKNEWSNIYLLKSIVDENSFEQGNIFHDGLTYGISRESFPYDYPFQDSLFQLFFNESLNSSFAFINCEEELDCGILGLFKNISNWIYNLGDAEDELLINEVCINICELEYCPPIEIDLVTECENSTNYILYLLDESGSIVWTPGEFDKIKDLVSSSSNEIFAINDNSFFGAATFSITTNFNIIEDFQNNPLNIDYHNPVGGFTDVVTAYQNVMTSIDNGDLSLDSDANFVVILVTDALVYTPFNVYNEIKQDPYNAKNIVIYFKDGNYQSAIPQAAAIASKGGVYIDSITLNTEDPEGLGVPRHLYVYDTIVPSICNVIDNFLCDKIIIDIASDLAVSEYSFSATRGGEVISVIDSITFITNGSGNYEYSFELEDGCSYVYSFSVENSEITSCETTSDEIHDVFSRPIHNNDEISFEDRATIYESETIDTRSVKESTFSIYPIPARDKLFINHKTCNECSFSFSILDMNGKFITSGKSSTNKHILSLDKFTAGMYFIELTDSDFNTFTNKIIIVK